MDLDIVVYWLALTAAAGIFLSARAYVGWMIETGAMVVGAPLLLVLAPAAAPWIVFAVVGVLVIVPMLVMRAATVFYRRQDYRSAGLVAAAAAALHPMDGWPASVRLYRALRLQQLDRGRIARDRLRGLTGQNTEVGLAAKVHLCRIEGDWQGLLDDPRFAEGNVAMLPMRLRALGELGRTGEMQAVFVRAEPTLRKAGARLLAQALLPLMAFGGRRSAVAALLGGPITELTSNQKRLWIATAQVAGDAADAAVGAATLENLASGGDPDTGRLARARMALRSPGQTGRPAIDAALADRLERELLTAAPTPKRRAARNVVTLALCTINVAVFVAEWISGDPESEGVLGRMGALVTSTVVEDGAWWRLVTAMFLHAGPIHLMANMLALAILGSVVEPLFGRWRYALMYFGAGIGSMACVVAFAATGLMPPALLVGASGAIMGLVGGLAAAALRQWFTEPSALALQRLARVGVAVALQTAIDLTTTRISFAAHASGAVIGFVIGALMRVRWKPLDGAGAFGAPAVAVDQGRRARLRQSLMYALVTAAVGASLWLAMYR